LSGQANADRLRVLTMSDSIGSHGGAEALSRQVAQRLDPERFESVFCATRFKSSAVADGVIAELRESGTEFIGLERHGRLDMGVWRGLLGEMRRRRIDVLHTHKIGSNFWGAMLAPRVPVPVFVAHEHSWSFEGQPRRKFIDRHLIGRRADAFVAVSRADRSRMIEIERIPPEKVRFIQNGIPQPAPARPRDEVRAELGVDGSAPMVAAVGTLRPEKCYEGVIEAAAEVRKRVPDVVVLIVGGEESDTTTAREPLERQIAARGLEGTVRMTGFRPDVFDLISAVDVACLNSDREGSPLSVMEYMAAGKPVVATRVGGVPDIVVDGQTGVLIDRYDPPGLAAALSELLLDPERAARMGQAGLERQREDFTLDATTRAIENLYEELIAKR
jgi:glycosyltransferase involved in cell wall biosynthesis